MNAIYYALDYGNTRLNNITNHLKALVIFYHLDEGLKELLSIYILLFENADCVNVRIWEVNVKVIAAKDH